MDHRHMYKYNPISKETHIAKRRNVVVQMRSKRRMQEFEKHRQMIIEHGGDSVSKNIEPFEICNDVSELLLQLQTAENFQCNYDQQLTAKQNVCRLVSNIKSQQQIDGILRLGILDKLVEYISAPALQDVAGRAVRQICGCSSEQVDQVFASGLVAKLFELLASPDTKVLFEALCALGNIINLGSKYCEALIDMGFLPKFTASLKTDMDLKIIHLFSLNVAALTSLPYKDWQRHTNVYLLPFINILMESTDDNVNFNCLCSMVYVTTGENVNFVIDEMFRIGLVEKVIKQLEKHNVEVLCRATLQIIENIVMANDNDRRQIINTHVLTRLSTLLKKKPIASVVKSGLRALASICTGNHARIEALFKADLFSVIMFYIETGCGDEQILAGWALSNILLSGCDNLIYEMITANMLSSITHLLPCPCYKLIYNLLRGLFHAFELFKDNQKYLVTVVKTSGMYEQLENLKCIENTEIADISTLIHDNIKRCILAQAVEVEKN